LLAGVEDFRAAGIEVHVATDDGSCGYQGLVTGLLETRLDAAETSRQSQHIVCCGPEPMMAAVARIARARDISCQVSLETPMACGIGLCFSCVAKVREGDAWDYKRTCVEGPVFDAAAIVW
jgi:dihydroorotate dehydrogenase electron transfer subunit